MIRNFFASSFLIFSFTSMSVTHAMSMDIFEFSGFINSSSIGSDSIRDTQIEQTGVGSNDFGSADIGVAFVNNLNADNFGTLQWIITNNNNFILNDVSFFGFLDAEIDEPINTFFNESGSQANFMAGLGSGDSDADSWEIDDPDNSFGDISANLFDGALDNSNALPSSDFNATEGDVAMALGFEIGDMQSNQQLVATFDISETDNGGLFHFDEASNFGFYFNGSVNLRPVATAVPGPSGLMLLFVGLLGLVASRKR